MAFTPVKRNYQAFIAASQLKPGATVTGFAVDFHTSEKFPDKENIVVQLHGAHVLPTKEKAEGEAEGKVIQKELKDGDLVILNGSGNLRYFRANKNPLGFLFQFRYNGMKTLTSGKMAGKQSHNWDILIDRSQKVEAAADTIPF